MSNDPLGGVLWTEKYRPTRLEDLAMEEEARTLLQSYLTTGEIPHLLLVGPPGSGKTTVARIIRSSLDCQTLSLNASAERGIDVVRDKIGTFVTSSGLARWNIVFLDEFDAMTSDAQTSLRNLMENYSDTSRYILTGNYLHKIIGPIQSRCQLLTLGRPPLKERMRVLARILEAEGIVTEPQILLGYAERYRDLRKLLFTAQKNILSHGHLPPVSGDGSVSGQEIFKLVRGKDWTGLRGLTTSSAFDPTQGLRDLFWAIPDEDPKAGFMRHLVQKGVHESTFTPDPVILFLGVCSEVMEGLS